jgi:RNA polymerase-binding protein DksA
VRAVKRVLNSARVEEFRHRLLEVRANLLRTVATTDDELATLERHQPGAPIEDATRDEVAGTLSRLEDRERHELEEVYAAWARLDAGTFGTCEDCHEPLPLVRLRAMPVARCCLPCQQKREGR